MARRDALLRLHKTLVARRDELRKRLGGELSLRAGSSFGDAADMAFDTGSDEVNHQLAEFESRELAQIELAIAKLKRGTYGVCEGCGKKIPVARLNALPFSATCIECQREMELYGDFEGPGSRVSWERVSDSPLTREEPREVSLSDLELDMPSR
jgi:DnaK suppressor protein